MATRTREKTRVRLGKRRTRQYAFATPVAQRCMYYVLAEGLLVALGLLRPLRAELAVALLVRNRHYQHVPGHKPTLQRASTGRRGQSSRVGKVLNRIFDQKRAEPKP